jgi:hypothetical protein
MLFNDLFTYQIFFPENSRIKEKHSHRCGKIISFEILLRDENKFDLAK